MEIENFSEENLLHFPSGKESKMRGIWWFLSEYFMN